jgi:putative RecB family exonuclease
VTVETGTSALPLSLSPSRAKDFAQCELRYFFVAVDRWRSPATEHTALGNIVHDALEALFRLPAADRTAEIATSLLDEAWKAYGVREEYAHLLREPSHWTTVRDRGHLAIEGLFHLEEPADVEVDPSELEAWTGADLYGAPIRGRIDRMTSGALWRVTDYKTGRQPADRYVEDALAGLFSYAATLAASHPTKRMPDEVELLYLLGPTRIRRPVLRDYLLKHAKRLAETWDRISAAYGSGRWVARSGPLCPWCSFQPICPLFEQSAPVPGSTLAHAALTGLGLAHATPGTATRDADRDAAETALTETP